MDYRTLGRTQRKVSVVGLGCWQLGADWGDVSEDDALDVLNAAIESGVTFLDTADVYGDGRSEQLVGRALREHEGLTVATKMGRRADPFVAEAYTLEAFRSWTDRSRRNLGVDTLDLVQLHCPPTAVYSDDRVYDALDTLVADGVMAAYGVSVETVDEALTAIARPHMVRRSAGLAGLAALLELGQGLLDPGLVLRLAHLALGDLNRLHGQAGLPPAGWDQDLNGRHCR
jgi:aryl-alcohol dehydrogenase-like predicted oxidoreductase